MAKLMNRIYQGRVSTVKISNALALSPSAIAPKVYWIRDEKVLLDYDLAALYGVTTFNLNKAVKRNSGRFPADFMFQLTAAEAENLRFQNGISRSGHGGRRYLPYAFRLKIPLWHPADKPSTLNIQRSTNK